MLNLNSLSTNKEIKHICDKILNNQRLSISEGLSLYNEADLGLLGYLANWKKESLFAKKVFYNKNFHIEPTNICVFRCKFCSYRRNAGDKEAWIHSINEIVKIVENYKDKPVTEVHIVGGVHPSWDLHYFGEMISAIKDVMPEIHIKAFSAIELDYMIQKSGMSLVEGINLLKSKGLNSVPGGGAEIFDEDIRKHICGEKSSGKRWIEIHKTAHQCGLTSNATILYGHIETYQHRLEHMEKIRQLQDETNGFNAFIPLKYRNLNNNLSHIGEVNTIEDLKNYAVSRLFIDNMPHLKAYWPMIGKETAQLALDFGVDDLDGTIDDSTKIYTMAGVKEKRNSMTIDEIKQLVTDSKREAIERDSVYNEVDK